MDASEADLDYLQIIDDTSLTATTTTTLRWVLIGAPIVRACSGTSSNLLESLRATHTIASLCDL